MPTFRTALHPFLRLLLLSLPLAVHVRAQSTTPVLTQALPAQTLSAPVTLDLRGYFGLPGVTGQLVQFNTVLGRFNIELFASAAPLNVANFLSYVNSSAYTNTIVHRSVPGFVIQGGGYKSVSGLPAIPTSAPVQLEYNLPNIRGTIAMARTASINSATSQWFINTVDNTTTLGPANGGGYTVFGRVLGTGMSVVDAIAALITYALDPNNANSPYNQVPMHDVHNNQLTLANLVTVTRVDAIPIYPNSGGGTAALGFTATTSDASVATASISGSDLILTPGGTAGTAILTVRATDTNGNFTTGTLQVTVSAMDQTISFGTLADVPFSATPVTLTATASSGLPVNFSVVSGPATLAGNSLTLTGTGSVTVRASQAGNASFNAAADVDRGFNVLPSFLSWQQGRFTAGELADANISGPSAVFGSDGLTNLVKYALGLDPKTDATTGLPELSTTSTDWNYTYTRPSSTTDVIYAVEVSTDLTTWTTDGVTLELVSSSGGVETWRASYPLSPAPNTFFRLKVSLVPHV